MREASLWASVIAAIGVLDSGLPEAGPPEPPPAQQPETPAAATDAEPPVGGHARDVVDYTLRAVLDPVAHSVHGEGTITWRNTSTSPTSEIWLHLYLNAFKNERSAFLRERVGGRGSVTPEDWGWIDIRRLALRSGAGDTVDLWPDARIEGADEADETDAGVLLPRPIEPGEEITLEVAFDDKLPAIVERTGYRGSFHMVGQWFPKIARLEPDGRWAHFPMHHLAEFYADFGTYDVTLDVPQAFVVGATGPVVESRVTGGRRIERHVQADVHDFAWTAWDRYRALHEQVDGVDVTLLYPPGYGRVAQRDLRTVRFGLPYFSARYGWYPYRVLTVVHVPDDAAEAGGMEYPTLITTEAPWWTPEGALVPEMVTIHELGHQWFYGMVANDELTWPVLDEGINQFAEIDALEKWRGPGSLVDLGGLRISDAALEAVGGNMRVHDEPVAQPANAFSTGANYSRLVYARTAAVLATLARVYGDGPVQKALGLYARRGRFEHPQPEVLLTAFRETLGPKVAATLRAALFDEGWVDYAVESVSSERAARPAGFFDRDGKREKVEAAATEDGSWESSVLVRRRGTLTFPVDVELTFEDGSTWREPWDGEGDWKRIDWRGPLALRGATVDPDDRVLIDMNRTNDSARAAPSPRRAPRVLERATYWMQLALQAVSP